MVIGITTDILLATCATDMPYLLVVSAMTIKVVIKTKPKKIAIQLQGWVKTVNGVTLDFVVRKPKLLAIT